MDQEFNQLMTRVLVSGLLLFGLAAGVLVVFFLGLGKEGAGDRKANSSHAVRGAVLVGILVAICLYFVWLAYR